MGAEVQKAQHEAPGRRRPHRRATCTGQRVRRHGAEPAVAARQQCAEAAHCHPTGGRACAGPARASGRGWQPGRSAVGAEQQRAGLTSRIHRAAQAGVTGPGERLPHHQAIQRSFGPAHDLSGVRAHVGGPAARANQAMRATAFTTGEHVAFKAPPDLWLAAHEAAHVVQQCGGVNLHGGVGRAARPVRAPGRHGGRPRRQRPPGARSPRGFPRGRRPAVQRCGGVIHEGCECAKEAMHAEETADHTATAVQRNRRGSARSTRSPSRGEVGRSLKSGAPWGTLAA